MVEETYVTNNTFKQEIGRLDNRMDSLESSLKHFIEVTEQNFIRLENKIDKLEDRVNKLESKIDKLADLVIKHMLDK